MLLAALVNSLSRLLGSLLAPRFPLRYWLTVLGWSCSFLAMACWFRPCCFSSWASLRLIAGSAYHASTSGSISMCIVWLFSLIKQFISI